MTEELVNKLLYRASISWPPFNELHRDLQQKIINMYDIPIAVHMTDRIVDTHANRPIHIHVGSVILREGTIVDMIPPENQVLSQTTETNFPAIFLNNEKISCNVLQHIQFSQLDVPIVYRTFDDGFTMPMFQNCEKNITVQLSTGIVLDFKLQLDMNRGVLGGNDTHVLDGTFNATLTQIRVTSQQHVKATRESNT